MIWTLGWLAKAAGATSRAASNRRDIAGSTNYRGSQLPARNAPRRLPTEMLKGFGLAPRQPTVAHLLTHCRQKAYPGRMITVWLYRVPSEGRDPALQGRWI